jgi:hypothetical protein
MCIKVLSFPPSLFSPAIYRQDPRPLIPLDATPPLSGLSLHQDLHYPRPEESMLFQLPLGSFNTHSILGNLPFRVGISDLAISRDSRYYPREINPENPMVNGQPRGIATRGTEPLPIKSPSTETAISTECATCTPLYKRGPILLRHVGSSPFAGPRLQSSYCWKPRTPEPRC